MNEDQGLRPEGEIVLTEKIGPDDSPLSRIYPMNRRSATGSVVWLVREHRVLNVARDLWKACTLL